MNTSNLQNAKNCSESLFNSIYDQLEAEVSKEATALYNQALSKAKTNKQKAACAGSYQGKWFTLFDKWCHGKVANVFVLEALTLGYIEEGLLS